jgi:uncharacterized membrane protein
LSVKNRGRTPNFPNRSSSVQKNQGISGSNQVHFQQVQHVQTIFDPEVVRKYGEIVPGAPERILVILEKNNQTERSLREKQAESEIEVNRLQAKDNQRRDWMAFLLVGIGLIISAFFAYLELIWLTASTLGAIAIAAIQEFLNYKRPQIGTKDII